MSVDDSVAPDLARYPPLGPDSAPANLAAAHGRLGGMLRRLARPDEALIHFRRAAELAPHDAGAQANLGQMLLALERAEEAVPHCRAAAALKPQAALLHLILGDALRCAGRFDEARSAYLHVIRLQPTLAQAHANLALLFRTRHKIHEAFAPLKQALALEPRNASFWKHLAELHGDWEDVAESVRCWQTALDLQPGQAGLHLGLAAALQNAGRFSDSLAHLRTALALAPDSAAAHVALGNMHEQLGERDLAEAAFRTALKLEPAFTLAHVSLAHLLRADLPEADFRAVEKRLGSDGLPNACRTRLLFALAGVLDARGEYGPAAQRACQANALALEQTERRGPYSPASHRHFVDGLIEKFDAAFFQRAAGGGVDSRRPVFVFGLPRSGTTLVEQILASHPRVHGAGELRLAWQSLMAIPEASGSSEEPLLGVGRVDAPSIRRLSAQHLGWLAARDEGRAERIVDKMPDNYLYLGLLAAMFPRATFIHCRREPRDVAVSCWFANFRWLDWTNDFGHIASRFAEYRRIMQHWQRVLPVSLHHIDYEDLVADPEAATRRLLAACTLDWDPACLDFHQTRRPVRTLSASQVRRPIYRHAVARWKNYERELGELFTRVVDAS